MNVPQSNPSKPRVLYFGTWLCSGHYWWSAGMRRGGLDGPTEALLVIDGKYPPKDGRQVEGRVTHQVVDGWTVLAWWDRTYDGRPGCNSAFVVEGVHDYNTALAYGSKVFPEIINGLKFELVPV